MSKRDVRVAALLAVSEWRKATTEEMMAYVQSPGSKKNGKGGALAVRSQLTTKDTYTYLKARFGSPNGIQELLRNDTSDNLYHWDYCLIAGGQNVYVVATARETHIFSPVALNDDEWKALILAIKMDFGRVGPQKKTESAKLEKWFVFLNKYAALADRCAEKHGIITDEVVSLNLVDPPSSAGDGDKLELPHLNDASERASKLYAECMELRLLAPVMAEAFINMMILILCKPEVRSNARLYGAFVRAEIDVKIFDLFHKCLHFMKSPDPADEEFKAFKRVMDKRNDAIHGNVLPERDYFEIVYFDGKRPVYDVAGDHTSAFFRSLEAQYDPKGAVSDYEDVQLFLAYLIGCLEPGAQAPLRLLLEDGFPGWNPATQRVGVLFPDHIAQAYMGTRFDDELNVVW